MSNIALIFASGIGSRMRSTVGPKQFLQVKNKPLLVYTLERFESYQNIDKIYLVVRQSREEYTRELIKEHKLRKIRLVVDKDSDKLTAHASIINGLVHMKKDGINDDDIVLIHDGVRPIIDNDTLDRNIEDTEEYGSSITFIPASETVARSLDGKGIESVTVRSEMVILQAPQAFKFGTAYELNQRAIKDGIVGTVVDQAELNRRYGKNLHLTEGLKGNVKITVPLDFTYFEFLVESGKYELILRGETV
jgi:4-diphosphocytidyl-2-methyl-D-erithritol synthase